MGVRYIGSKARVADTILGLVGDSGDGRFVDAFCGTGAVAAAAADRGWPVTLNDALPSAVAMSIGAVVGRGNVPFAALGGYSEAIRELNAVAGRPGFLHSQYSPASVSTGPVERRYFTEPNAARLDAMRARIRSWAEAGHLTEFERELLLADLLQAANSVANISGTVGCFLKGWSPSALRPIRIRERDLPSRTTDLHVSVGDVFTVPTTEADIVYFDPPYTKRQYGAYYHVLETIHAGDAPEVSGVTGLRPWKDKASDFCYKTRALNALTRLILGTRRTYPARVAFIAARDIAAARAAQSQLDSPISPAGLAAIRDANSSRRGLQRKGIVVTCKWCGVQFCPLKAPGKREFCSRSCASRHNRRRTEQRKPLRRESP